MKNRNLYKICASVACGVIIIFCINMIMENMSQYEIINSELEELHNRAMTLGFPYEYEMFRLESELAALESGILPLSDRTDTILNLSRMFEESGLIKTDFSIGQLVMLEGDLYRTSVIISGIGIYNVLLDFIDNVRAQEGVVQIENMLLVKEYELPENNVRISMELVFYNHR